MSILEHVVDGVAFTIGIIGLIIIVYGILIGAIRALRIEVRALRATSLERDRRSLRRDLGYYLLLGLEFLVAADIIHTIVQPNMDELIRLSVIVLIRTVLNVSLTWEIERSAEVVTAEES
ncbi:MAG: DUF1622 domain-containing protein [Gemmatimonadota bacterium]